jgi:N utilization substance protein B
MRAQGRTGARRMLLQALYQMQLGGHSTADLVDQFADHPDADVVDQEYFRGLLNHVGDSQSELDAKISEFGDIPDTQLDPVEKAILWIALTELQHSDDVPTKVVINEAVELAKTFGAEGGYKYVNGVVDKAAASLR